MYIFVATQNIMEVPGKDRLPAQLQWVESGAVQRVQGNHTKVLPQGTGQGPRFLMCHLSLEFN